MLSKPIAFTGVSLMRRTPITRKQVGETVELAIVLGHEEETKQLLPDANSAPLMYVPHW